jgi:hypothetical protein
MQTLRQLASPCPLGRPQRALFPLDNIVQPHNIFEAASAGRVRSLKLKFQKRDLAQPGWIRAWTKLGGEPIKDIGEKPPVRAAQVDVGSKPTWRICHTRSKLARARDNGRNAEHQEVLEPNTEPSQTSVIRYPSAYPGRIAANIAKNGHHVNH